MRHWLDCGENKSFRILFTNFWYKSFYWFETSIKMKNKGYERFQKCLGGIIWMGNNSKKNTTTRFLICSFIGLLVLSIIIFSLLGAYMSRKSKNTVYEIGNIYMSGMNEQMLFQQITVIRRIYMRNSFTGHKSEDLTI